MRTSENAVKRKSNFGELPFYACRRIAMGSARGLRTITGHSNHERKDW
jgi:hypothetical protein